MKTEIMSIPDKFCCICMNKRGLKHLCEVDSDGVSHYNKLTSSIAEMNFKEMNDQRLICGECCVTLNTVYCFRRMCLRSKINLITYISQQQMSNQTSRTVCLEYIEPELIIVKNEAGSENEGSNCLEGSNTRIKFQSESYKENIGFSGSVKEECESEDDSPAHEDATVDHVDEGVYRCIKVEDRTMMEDYSEYYAEYNKIEIKEDPLAIVKKELMSDSETPQDGSTCLADTGSYEEPKGSEETTIGTELNIITYKDNEGLHQCEICQKSINGKESLMNHMQTHSSKKSHECEVRKMDFNCKYKHMTTHSSERPHKCNICNKDFKHKVKLTRHMETHSNERPYECKICNKGFKQQHILSQHMIIHSCERPYECKICHKGFKHKHTLTYHMSTHSSERPHKCNLCNKDFKHKERLTQHMSTHSSERPHKCNICNKNFKEKERLIKHIETHSKKGTYECEVCKKCLNYKNSLMSHMKLAHSSERPYECEICKKGFKFKGSLTAHMEIHSSERPYECEICSKGFKQKHILTQHMNTHSSEMPYECEICKRAFKYKCSLTVHMEIHISERAHECKICKKRYNYKNTLTAHMKTHSNEAI